MTALTFAQHDGEWVVVSDDAADLMIRADTIAGLVNKAKEHSGGSFLSLERGTALIFDGTLADRATLLAALVPNESLNGALCERFEVLREDNPFTDIGPIDTGTTVNGAPWGWVLTRYGHSDFALIPIVPEPEVIASFNAWQSGSMTGAVENWELRLYGELPVLCHEADESEPENTYTEPFYAPLGHEELLSLVTSGWIEDVEVPCPVCAETGQSWMGGWVTTLSDDGTFSEEEVGSALAQVWRPCAMHASGDVIIDNGGDRWRWVGQRWALAPAPATNSP